MSERVTIVVPGDDPLQIAGSPHLQRLAPYGDVVIHASRPESSREKIARVQNAQVIINSRGIVTWREPELRAYGTAEEHEAAHGLSPAGLNESIRKFLAL